MTLSRSIPALTAAAILAACSAQTQMTSGADYIARAPTPAASETITRVVSTRDGKSVTATREVLSTDELVRRAASIEPVLTLPARIGLARIEHGRLTIIPPHEAALWQALAARHPGVGQAVALDPFLAEYTTRTVLPQDQRRLRRDADDIITKIRLGGARQHLDAVLIYEIGTTARHGDRIEGLGSLRILGAGSFVPTSRTGAARALLLDVRNGYPYATVAASADLDGAEAEFWAGDADAKSYEEATRRIVTALTGDVDRVFAQILRSTQTLAARK